MLSLAARGLHDASLCQQPPRRGDIRTGRRRAQIQAVEKAQPQGNPSGYEGEARGRHSSCVRCQLSGGKAVFKPLGAPRALGEAVERVAKNLGVSLQQHPVALPQAHQGNLLPRLAATSLHERECAIRRVLTGDAFPHCDPL